MIPQTNTPERLQKVALLLAEEGYHEEAAEILALRMPLRGRDPLELLKSKFKYWTQQRKRRQYLDNLWPAFETVYNRIEAVPLRTKIPGFYVDDPNALYKELKSMPKRWRELPAGGARRLFVTKKRQMDTKGLYPRGDLVLALLLERKFAWIFFAHRAALTALKNPKLKAKAKNLTNLFVIPGRTEFTQEGESNYIWHAGDGASPYHTVVSLKEKTPGYKYHLELDMDIDDFIRWYDYQYSRGRVGDVQIYGTSQLHEDDRNKLELWLKKNGVHYMMRPDTQRVDG